MEHPLYYTQKVDYLRIPMFSKRHVFDKTTGMYSLNYRDRELSDGSYICFFSHMHNETEMIYIVRGSMFIKTRSGLSVASEGDTIILNSYEPHYGYINDEHPCVEYCYFTVNLPQLIPPIRYGITTRFADLVFSERVHDAEIGNMINRLPEYCLNMCKNGSAELAMLSVLYGVIARLEELGCIKEDSTDTQDQSFEAQIDDFLEKHYDENITTEILQNHFKYSKSYFCRLFKKCYGTTFSAYLDQFRVTKAATIMKYNKNLSISQIAAKVGYPNCSVFSYKFKKFIGTSPSEYKNNL